MNEITSRVCSCPPSLIGHPVAWSLAAPPTWVSAGGGAVWVLQGKEKQASDHLS